MNQGWGPPPGGPSPNGPSGSGTGFPNTNQAAGGWGYAPTTSAYGIAPVPEDMNGICQCHFCAHTGLPKRERQISEKGILIAVVLGVLCFPLALIPLLTMKDEKLSCARCGAMFGNH